LTDATLEITEKGKQPVVFKIKANEVMYGSAVVHTAKNIGTTPLRMILTEIKPANTGTMNSASGAVEKGEK
jgi:heme/copper-type cytochrome/quinol oxidase subunit 2